MATTFDPAHTGPSGALSGGNLTFKPTTGQMASRAAVGWTMTGTQKVEFRFKYTAVDVLCFPCVGIAIDGDTFTGNGLIGYSTNSSQNGWSFADNDGGTTAWIHGGSINGIGTVNHIGGGRNINDIIAIVVDPAANSIKYYMIGWNGSSYDAPLLVYTNTGLTPGLKIYPACGSGSGGALNQTFQADFAGSTFAAAPKIGDIAYDAAVAVPPVADFTGTPVGGTIPLAVVFTDASSGAPTSWAWDFGDGNTSTSQNPSHSYASTGYFTVVMTATNVAGSNTKTRTNYIHTVPVPVAPTKSTVPFWHRNLIGATGLAISGHRVGVISPLTSAITVIDIVVKRKPVLSGSATCPLRPSAISVYPGAGEFYVLAKDTLYRVNQISGVVSHTYAIQAPADPWIIVTPAGYVLAPAYGGGAQILSNVGVLYTSLDGTGNEGTRAALVHISSNLYTLYVHDGLSGVLRIFSVNLTTLTYQATIAVPSGRPSRACRAGDDGKLYLVTEGHLQTYDITVPYAPVKTAEVRYKGYKLKDYVCAIGSKTFTFLAAKPPISGQVVQPENTWGEDVAQNLGVGFAVSNKPTIGLLNADLGRFMLHQEL